MRCISPGFLLTNIMHSRLAKTSFRMQPIFEHALDVDLWSIQLWMSYTEMELKNCNVQHSCNLFDHTLMLLPWVDQLW